MPALVDLKGKKFGRLVVLERSSMNKKGKPSWICQCDCGRIVDIKGNELRRNETRSCGCLRIDNLRIDLTGSRFGKLTVITTTEKKGSSSSQFWLCKCDCGNDHVASSQHLRENQVKSCGCWFYRDEDEILENAKERFFSNIEKTESCWNWKSSFNRGYGMIFYKKNMKAHRFSYLIHKGNIPVGKIICHTCDNPKCVNPDHLYAGTVKENHEDMVKRGRFKPRGKSIPKLLNVR